LVWAFSETLPADYVTVAGRKETALPYLPKHDCSEACLLDELFKSSAEGLADEQIHTAFLVRRH